MGELPDVSRVRAAARVLAAGLLAGVGAGGATFVYFGTAVTPPAVRPWMALTVVAATGAAVHPVLPDLDESVAAALVGLLTGVGLHIAAWVSPLYLLGYPPAARTVLLPRFAGEAVSTAILVTVLAFSAGYFTTVFLDGLTS